MKMKIRFVWLAVALIIVGVLAVGCYTVLTHPRVQGEEEETIEHTGAYYREHCTDCHGDYHSYPYGYYYGFYPDYYWSNPRWGHYYAYPWWWDRYWWDDDDDAEYVPISDEKADRRRGLEPPYVPDTRTPAPFVSEPPPRKEEQPAQVKSEEKPKPREQQKKEEKPKDQKAKRRRR